MEKQSKEQVGVNAHIPDKEDLDADADFWFKKSKKAATKRRYKILVWCQEVHPYANTMCTSIHLLNM